MHQPGRAPAADLQLRAGAGRGGGRRHGAGLRQGAAGGLFAAGLGIQAGRCGDPAPGRREDRAAPGDRGGRGHGGSARRLGLHQRHDRALQLHHYPHGAGQGRAELPGAAAPGGVFRAGRPAGDLHGLACPGAADQEGHPGQGFGIKKEPRRRHFVRKCLLQAYVSA